jgi:anti-sigma factor RsiW
MPDLPRPFRRRRRRDGPLRCRELVELVSDYLEDALSEAQRSRIDAHIAGCGNCAGYVRQMRETLLLVGSIAPESLSAQAERELLQAFRDWRERPS